MVWFRNLIGKNQSVAVNAARLRFLAEIELCQGIFLEQPKDTVFGVRHYFAPGVEHVWRDLEALIERAKDNGVVGQVLTLAADRCVRDRLRVVGNEIAMRQVGGRFAIGVQMCLRGNGLVREHVVDEGGAIRAWESDIRDL